MLPFWAVLYHCVLVAEWDMLQGAALKLYLWKDDYLVDANRAGFPYFVQEPCSPTKPAGSRHRGDGDVFITIVHKHREDYVCW